MKSAIAVRAGVDPLEVELTISAGSVIADVSIQTYAVTAASVQSTMASATRSPSSATAMLANVTGVSIVVLAVPETDARDLQSLEALLQIERPEWLGKGKDVKKSYGPYDKLKLACAWKVDHPCLMDKYTTGKKRVQKEIERLRKKGKNVADVPGLPVKTAQNLLDLLSTGLNERYSSTNLGTAFGDGVYLAEEVEKTDQYVSADSKYDPSSELHKRLYDETVPHPDDVFYVLVVRAALGFSVRTQCTLDKKAPTHELRAARVTSMDDSARIFPVNCRELSAVPGVMPKIHHHSLIAELGKDIVRYREFILFHSEYVHIDYVIAYHRYNGDQKLCTTDSECEA
eukprot:jgi/Chrpa1/16365/Chrysochromulina_OHIO_Genome00023538-RA